MATDTKPAAFPDMTREFIAQQNETLRLRTELGHLRDVETEARVALLVLEKQGPTRNAVVINRLRTVLDALDAARKTR